MRGCEAKTSLARWSSSSKEKKKGTRRHAVHQAPARPWPPSLNITCTVDARGASLTFRQNSVPSWLPHWPTCSVTISRGILNLWLFSMGEKNELRRFFRPSPFHSLSLSLSLSLALIPTPARSLILPSKKSRDFLLTYERITGQKKSKKEWRKVITERHHFSQWRCSDDTDLDGAAAAAALRSLCRGSLLETIFCSCCCLARTFDEELVLASLSFSSASLPRSSATSRKCSRSSSEGSRCGLWSRPKCTQME